MNLFPLPDYARVKQVNSFDELAGTRFANGVNALCWKRTLSGDFAEIVALLGANEGIVALEDAQLRSLSVGAAGRAAIDLLLEDQRRLRDHGVAPVLNCVHGYPCDEEPGQP